MNSFPRVKIWVVFIFFEWIIKLFFPTASINLNVINPGKLTADLNALLLKQTNDDVFVFSLTEILTSPYETTYLDIQFWFKMNNTST